MSLPCHAFFPLQKLHISPVRETDFLAGTLAESSLQISHGGSLTPAGWPKKAMIWRITECELRSGRFVLPTLTVFEFCCLGNCPKSPPSHRYPPPACRTRGPRWHMAEFKPKTPFTQFNIRANMDSWWFMYCPIATFKSDIAIFSSAIGKVFVFGHGLCWCLDDMKWMASQRARSPQIVCRADSVRKTSTEIYPKHPQNQNTQQPGHFGIPKSLLEGKVW